MSREVEENTSVFYSSTLLDLRILKFHKTNDRNLEFGVVYFGKFDHLNSLD